MKQFDMVGPTPLYMRIKQVLKNRIENKEYELNMKLPPEKELVKEFGVSRPTVRRAISELVKERYVTRSQGKGTFVTWTEINPGILGSLYTHSEKLLYHHTNFISEVIKKGVISANEQILEKLRLLHDDKVFEIKRVRYLDKDPVIMTTSYLPYARVPNINSKGTNYESIHGLLTETFGYKIAKGIRTFEVGTAGKAAELLKIEEADPVLNVESITYLNTGEPIEYVEATIKREYSRFTVELV